MTDATLERLRAAQRNRRQAAHARGIVRGGGTGAAANERLRLHAARLEISRARPRAARRRHAAARRRRLAAPVPAGRAFRDPVRLPGFSGPVSRRRRRLRGVGSPGRLARPRPKGSTP